MPNEGFHTVTVREETYSILKDYSKRSDLSIPETIHSLLRGLDGIRGLKFYVEYICLNCGHRPSTLTEVCPICKGTVCVRYVVKSSAR